MAQTRYFDEKELLKFIDPILGFANKGSMELNGFNIFTSEQSCSIFVLITDLFASILSRCSFCLPSGLNFKPL